MVFNDNLIKYNLSKRKKKNYDQITGFDVRGKNYFWIAKYNCHPGNNCINCIIAHKLCNYKLKLQFDNRINCNSHFNLNKKLIQ